MPRLRLGPAAVDAVQELQARFGQVGQREATRQLGEPAAREGHRLHFPRPRGRPVGRGERTEGVLGLGHLPARALQRGGVFRGVLQQVVAVAGAGHQREAHLAGLALLVAHGAGELGGRKPVDAAALGAAVDRLDRVADDLLVRATGVGRHELHHQPGIALAVDEHDRLGRVLHLPAGRRGERDAQGLVVEVAPPHHALLAAVAEGHAFNGLQVAPAGVVTVLARILGGVGLDVGQALVVGRVRGEPARRRRLRPALGLGGLGGKRFLVLEHLDHVDHVLRVVAVARQVLGAELVGLRFLVAAVRGDVAGRGRLRDLAREVGRAAHARAFEHRAKHRGGQHADAGALLAGGALRTVAGGHVADLVADHAGQLGLAVEVGHDPARHVDIAAGQREGVDLRAVEHGEGPLEVGPVRLRGQALAELVHVGLQLCVGVGAVFLQHPLVGFLAFGDLVLLAHDRALGLAGDGVDDVGAAARHEGGRQQERQEKVQTMHGGPFLCSSAKDGKRKPANVGSPAIGIPG